MLACDDILLPNSDLGLLHDFKVIDMCEANYVIGIRDLDWGLLELSQKWYINQVMKDLICQCVQPLICVSQTIPKVNMERGSVKLIPYTLLLIKNCTIPDISYVAGVLGIYRCKPGIEFWEATKFIIRYI